MANFKISIITITLIIFFTSGCTTLIEGLEDFNSSLETINESLIVRPILVNDPAKEICSKAKMNESRTNKEYFGKGISIDGSINSTFSILNDTFYVEESDDISFSIKTEEIDTDKLSNGDQIKMKGTIEYVFIHIGSCVITLHSIYDIEHENIRS